MNNKVIHSIGIFHTEGTDEHSHCAYTQKTRRLVTMLAARGYKVVHYHAGDFEPIYGPFKKEQVDRNLVLVQLFGKEQLYDLREKAKRELGTNCTFEGDLANVGTSLFRVFDAELQKSIRSTTAFPDKELFLHHFGWPHKALGNIYPYSIHIEPGIGYPDTFAPYRIFESKAWLDHITGKQNQLPQYGDFVIPNHFDETYWFSDEHIVRDKISYMGRIYDHKGAMILGEISNYLNETIHLAGQVDNDYLKRLQIKYPKLEYVGVLKGKSRVEYLQSSIISLLPTQYFEPFGGAIIEAGLCGAYPITSDFGVFNETIHRIYGKTCRTLKDYIDAIVDYKKENNPLPLFINLHYRKFGMERLSFEYKAVIEKIIEMHNHGWKGNLS